MLNIILYSIIAIQAIIIIVALVGLFRTLSDIKKMSQGLGLLIEKFFDQSNSNIKLIDRTINNASENMNSVLRSIQRVKRSRE